MDILEVDSVILEFGPKRVLQNIYLQSETGKVTGILGRNGSGKSCLMKIVFGEIIPFDKSIRINGISIHGAIRSPKDMRYLPQNRFMPRSLSIRKIFKDFKLDFSDFIEIFPEFKQYFHIALRKLSGGERRVVEIYAILASESKFCMLDEPFSQIMPIHIEKIKHLIQREKKKKGIVITDHMYKHIIDICDDLYVLANGKTNLTKSLNDIEMYGYAKRRE